MTTTFGGGHFTMVRRLRLIPLSVDDDCVLQILDLSKTLDGQVPSQINTFADQFLPIIKTFAVSSDGSQVALTRARKTSGIVQIIGESQPTAR